METLTTTGSLSDVHAEDGAVPHPPLTDSRFHALVDESPYAIVMYSQGAFLYANTAALVLFGARSFDHLAMQVLTDLIHPDDRALFAARCLQPGDTRDDGPCEIRCLRLDGTTIWMDARCAHVQYESVTAEEIVLRDITVRKRTEERHAQQSFVMDGINRILHAGLQAETIEDLGRTCLDIIEGLTGSAIGFIGEITEKGVEKISLDGFHRCADAVLMATMPLPSSGGFAMHGLYDQVLTEGKAFFTNNPSHHVGTLQIPDGHPHIASYLGVPLKHEGRTVGIIGIGNKPGGYSAADMEQVEAIAPAVVESFMRMRMKLRNQDLLAQTRRDAVTKSELLNEVNHRVKNNLMTILGLILAQKRHMSAEQLKQTEHIWEKFELRINGMLRVHQMLSDSQWTPMNLCELGEHICAGVLDLFDMTEMVALSVEPTTCEVSPRQAGSLALVFNELMTNSLKYALQYTVMPSVTLQFRLEGETIAIIFRDNGPGYSGDVIDKGRQNVGLRLLHQLVEGTLDGSVRLFNDGGAVAELRIRYEGTSMNRG